MLDLDSLRLTDEEIDALCDKETTVLDTDIADAQLAKALWGIQEWLKDVHSNSGQSITWKRWKILEQHLLAAGMPDLKIEKGV